MLKFTQFQFGGVIFKINEKRRVAAFERTWNSSREAINPSSLSRDLLGHTSREFCFIWVPVEVKKPSSSSFLITNIYFHLFSLNVSKIVLPSLWLLTSYMRFLYPKAGSVKRLHCDIFPG